MGFLPKPILLTATVPVVVVIVDVAVVVVVAVFVVVTTVVVVVVAGVILISVVVVIVDVVVFVETGLFCKLIDSSNTKHSCGFNDFNFLLVFGSMSFVFFSIFSSIVSPGLA